MLLDGRVAIVSGVGPGMGLQISLALAREGAAVVMAARSEEALGKMAEEVASTGARVLAVPMDLTDPAGRDRLIDAVGNEFGWVDVLVNNVGHPGNFKTLADTRLDSWRRTMEVNFFATLDLTRAVIPLMAGRSGRIIMINTMASIRPGPTMGAYAASKAALATVSVSLARELGPLGIRVNNIHPGPIWGEHYEAHVRRLAEQRGVDFETALAEEKSRLALGYIPGADQIAGTALFLASDMSLPVTGQSIAVDCGSF